MYIIIVIGMLFLGVCYIGESRQSVREAAARKREWDALKLSEIKTSSTNIIHGKNIINHIRLITHSGKEDTAEHYFLKKVKESGGNGVIQMRVEKEKDDVVVIQGDAVVVG